MEKLSPSHFSDSIFLSVFSLSNLSNHMKYVLAATSLMLIFVFTGCCSTGPFGSHSAFKQSALPSGYQTVFQNQTGYGAAGAGVPQLQSANYPPVYAPRQGVFQVRNANPVYGYGAAPQHHYRFGGQATFPQNNQGLAGGLMSPFVGSTYASGSC